MCPALSCDCPCDKDPAPRPSDTVSIFIGDNTPILFYSCVNFRRRPPTYLQALDAIYEFIAVIPASLECICCAVSGCEICCCSLQKLQDVLIACWCGKCKGLLCGVCEKTLPDLCLCLHPELTEEFVSLEEVLFRLGLLFSGSTPAETDTGALLPRAREIIFALEDRPAELEAAAGALNGVRAFFTSPRWYHGYCRSRKMLCSQGLTNLPSSSSGSLQSLGSFGIWRTPQRVRNSPRVRCYRP